MPTAMETMVEALAKQVESYNARIKAQEARYKELKSEVDNAEQEAVEKIAKARAKADAEIAALQQEVTPYRDLVKQIEAQKAQLAELKRSMETETARLREERHRMLTDLDRRVAIVQERLSKLAQEEAAFRKRVAMV